MVSAISLPESVSASLVTMYDSEEPLWCGEFRKSNVEGVDDDLENYVSMINTTKMVL